MDLPGISGQVVFRGKPATGGKAARRYSDAHKGKYSKEGYEVDPNVLADLAELKAEQGIEDAFDVSVFNRSKKYVVRMAVALALVAGAGWAYPPLFFIVPHLIIVLAVPFYIYNRWKDRKEDPTSWLIADESRFHDLPDGSDQKAPK